MKKNIEHSKPINKILEGMYKELDEKLKNGTIYNLISFNNNNKFYYSDLKKFSGIKSSGWFTEILKRMQKEGFLDKTKEDRKHPNYRLSNRYFFKFIKNKFKLT